MEFIIQVLLRLFLVLCWVPASFSELMGIMPTRRSFKAGAFALVLGFVTEYPRLFLLLLDSQPAVAFLLRTASLFLALLPLMIVHCTTLSTYKRPRGQVASVSSVASTESPAPAPTLCLTRGIAIQTEAEFLAASSVTTIVETPPLAGPSLSYGPVTTVETSPIPAPHVQLSIGPVTTVESDPVGIRASPLSIGPITAMETTPIPSITITPPPPSTPAIIPGSDSPYKPRLRLALPSSYMARIPRQTTPLEDHHEAPLPRPVPFPTIGQLKSAFYSDLDASEDQLRARRTPTFTPTPGSPATRPDYQHPTMGELARSGGYMLLAAFQNAGIFINERCPGSWVMSTSSGLVEFTWVASNRVWYSPDYELGLALDLDIQGYSFQEYRCSLDEMMGQDWADDFTAGPFYQAVIDNWRGILRRDESEEKEMEERRRVRREEEEREEEEEDMRDPRRFAERFRRMEEEAARIVEQFRERMEVDEGRPEQPGRRPGVWGRGVPYEEDEGEEEEGEEEEEEEEDGDDEDEDEDGDEDEGGDEAEEISGSEAMGIDGNVPAQTGVGWWV